MKPSADEKERERTFSVSFCESEWETIQGILLAEVRRCERLAKMTAHSGYGKASTQHKAQEWLRRAETLDSFLNAIQEKQF